MDESQINSKTKRRSYFDRASLSYETLELLRELKQQLDDVFHGMVSMTYTEIINLRMKHALSKFTQAELNEIQQTKLSDVDKAKWLYEELKKAQTRGEHVELQTLLAKANGAISPLKQRRKRTQKIQKIDPLSE